MYKYIKKMKAATSLLLLMLFSINSWADAVKIYYSLPEAEVGENQVVELYAVNDVLLGSDKEYGCVMNKVATYYGYPVYCAELEDATIDKLQFRICNISTSGEGENAKISTTPVPEKTRTAYEKGTWETSKKLSDFKNRVYNCTKGTNAWEDVAFDSNYRVYYAGNLSTATAKNGSTTYGMTVTDSGKKYHDKTVYSVECSIPFVPNKIVFDSGSERDFVNEKLYTEDAVLEYAYDGGPYTLTGNFNAWASPGLELTATDDPNVVSTSLYIMEGASDAIFKIIYDGFFYGSNGTVTKDANTITVSRDAGENAFRVTPELSGMYVISLDKTNLQVTVTYPTYDEAENPHNKPVWQQADATADNYFKNRKALVGNGCEVNKLSVVVGVGSWASGLGNLTDEDLSNHVSLTKVVGASIGTNPITGVRDMNNHYAAGTKAGFHVLTSSDSKVLSLDVIKAFAISFYCEGKLVGTVPIAPEVQVLQLDLISFSAQSGATIDIEATAPAEFDEILLQPGGGINADVVNSMQIQYAYVGDSYKYTLTNQGAGNAHGIEEYNADYNCNLHLSATYGGASTSISDKLIDADFANGVSGNTLTLGNLICAVKATPASGDEAPFKAGSNVGMHFSSGSVLNLGIGGTKVMQLLDKDDKVIQEEHLNTTVLGLGVATGGAGDNVITAEKDFYGVKFVMAGISVNVGAFVTHYFYVTPPPSVNHKCPIQATANADLCDFESTFQLSHNPEVTVEWTVEEQPAGANVTINQSTELASGLSADGTYKFRATATSCTHETKCYELVTVTKGDFRNTDGTHDSVLDSISNTQLTLSDKIYDSSGSLLSISNLSDPENILNGQYDDFAQYVSGLSLINNLMVVGVKSKDGSIILANGNPVKRVGFVVETTSTGLDLAALQIFNIRGYRNGEEVFSHPVEESNAVALNLIGSNKVQKMRFSVAVKDTETEIDEIQLWKSGTLNLTLSTLNIYYAFANDTEDASGTLDASLGCGLEIVSNKSTGASINSDANSNLQVLGVANVSDNITYLIDDDPNLETYLTIANTVNAGGQVFAVRLGRTFTAAHQIGIVMDNESYLASINAGSWMTMKTFKNGVATGDENNDWKVLGVNAIGSGDKRLLLMYPTKDYDEVQLTFGTIAGALDYPKIYGIVVRSDIDQDGIPDCQDTQSCFQELILDEDAGRSALANDGSDYREADFNTKEIDYKHARLVLHRNITRAATIEDNLWVSLTLPVNLTGLQLRNAFGNQTRLAKADGILSENNNRINFNFIDLDADKDNDGTPDLDKEVVVEAGSYYIIQVVRQPQIGKDETYVSSTEPTRNGVVDGEVYFVNEVDCDKGQTNPVILGDNVESSNNTLISFCGTYAATNFGGAGKSTYAFNGGQLYHTTQAAHNMLGFRFWIEENAAPDAPSSSNYRQLDFTVTDADGDVTHIIPIGDGTFVNADANVYTTSGILVGKASEVSSPGIYVTNGRKYIVK